MANYAKLDENNVVIDMIYVDDNHEDGQEGEQWVNKNFPGRWIKASFHTMRGEHSKGKTPLRKNFPAPGDYYDEERDAFVKPKPFESWILDEQTCDWIAPIPRPPQGEHYLVYWDETFKRWMEI